MIGRPDGPDPTDRCRQPERVGRSDRHGPPAAPRAPLGRTDRPTPPVGLAGRPDAASSAASAARRSAPPEPRSNLDEPGTARRGSSDRPTLPGATPPTTAAATASNRTGRSERRTDGRTGQLVRLACRPTGRTDRTSDRTARPPDRAPMARGGPNGASRRGAGRKSLRDSRQDPAHSGRAGRPDPSAAPPHPHAQ